jgi:GNAT superfamily N-acetyltransferase
MSTPDTRDRTIRRAGADEVDVVARTVAAAFFDDPVTRWLLPDVDQRRRVVEPMFRLYVAPYVRHGETYLAGDGDGAAVWLPPGVELQSRDEEAELGRALEALVGPDLRRFELLAQTFEQHHPREPLYYCQFLATMPALQGRGIGSTFLRQMLARADREGMPAYHEATTPRNRALYERHGYVNEGVFELPDGGPPLWRMWRSPR